MLSPSLFLEREQGRRACLIVAPHQVKTVEFWDFKQWWGFDVAVHSPHFVAFVVSHRFHFWLLSFFLVSCVCDLCDAPRVNRGWIPQLADG